MTYILYGVPDFANLAVHIVLEEIGAPYRVDFLEDMEALKAPDHLARHPLGLVPAMETPDGMLFETAAILLWLADRHGLAPAPQDADRGAFLSWLFYASNTLHTGAMDLIHPYRPAGEDHSATVAAEAHARLLTRLAPLEAIAATRPRWMSPDAPGVMGPYIGMLMRWLRAFPWDPSHAFAITDYPALHALVSATEMRPATQRAGAANGLSGRFLTAPDTQADQA